MTMRDRGSHADRQSGQPRWLSRLAVVCSTAVLVTAATWPLHGQDGTSSAGRVRVTGYAPEPAAPIPHTIGTPPTGSGAGSAPMSSQGFVPQGELVPYQQAQYVDYSPVLASQSTLSAPYALTENPFDPKLRVDNRSGGLMGYNSGYTSLGGFLPLEIDPNNLLFADLRVLLTNDGDTGGNVGFGHRRYTPEYDRVTSLSGWYDYDGGHESDYDQFGVSYAMISRYLQFRANANFVNGPTRNLIRQECVGDLFFSGNNLAILSNDEFENAFNVYDFELGTPVPFLGKYGFNGFAGAYYVDPDTSADQDAVGFKGRVTADITEDWSMGVSVSDDRVFGTNVQLAVQFTIPDGKASRWFRPKPIYEYLAMSDERSYRVNARSVISQSEQVLINPEDGAAFDFAIIDPSLVDGVAPAGDGTLANPFNSLAAYNDAALNPTPQGFDIILVRGGDGAGTNLEDGITIFERQRLLANSKAHDISGVVCGVNFTGQIPGTGTGAQPILSNVNNNAPVVTISNAFVIAQDSPTEVTGFGIDGTPPLLTDPLNVGIQGFALTEAYDIFCNDIFNTSRGVEITSTATSGRVRDNEVTGGGILSDRGISVIQTGGPTVLEISGNDVANVSGEDQDGDGRLDVDEDTNGNGSLDPGEDLDGDGRLDVNEDTLVADGMGNDGIGIFVGATGGATIDARLTGVTGAPSGITNNIVSGNGSGIVLDATSGTPSVIVADVTSNIMSDNTTGVGPDFTGAGFAANADGAGNAVLLNSYLNNTTDNNSGDGGRLVATNSGNVSVLDVNATDNTFTGNSFDGNGNNGLSMIADTNGFIGVSNLGDPAATAPSNTFNGNTNDGLGISATNTGKVQIGIPDVLGDPIEGVVNNEFNGNGNNGLSGVVDGAGSNLVMSVGDATSGLGNTFNNNGATSGTGDGIHLELSNNPTVVVDVFNNQILSNTEDGVEILATNMNGVPLDGVQITNNEVRLNGDDGVSVTADAATISNLLLSENQAGGPSTGISQNLGNGVELNLSNGSSLENFIATSNNIDLNGLNGIALLVNDTSAVSTSTIINNTITNSVAGAGVRIDNPTATATTIDLDFVNNTITGNATQGVLANLSGATMTTEIISNNISNNGAEGLFFNLSDIADLQVDEFFNNTVNGNGGIGLRVDAVDSSNFDLTSIGANGPNLFDGNTDAGIGIQMFDLSTGALQVVDTTIINTVDGPLGSFFGDGIGITMVGNSIMSLVQVGDPTDPNTILQDNAGNGFLMDISGSAQSNLVNIENVLVDGNGVVTDLANPVFSGLHFIRRANSQYQDVNIDNNVVTNNGNHGIQVEGFGGRNDVILATPLFTNDFSITNNLIDNNGSNGQVGPPLVQYQGSGIDLLASGDIDLLVNISNNEITNNSVDGINGQGDLFGSLRGTWMNNTITGNGSPEDGGGQILGVGRGIDLLANRNAVGTNNIVPNIDVVIDANLIDNNLLDGIRAVSNVRDSQGAVNDPTLFDAVHPIGTQVDPQTYPSGSDSTDLMVAIDNNTITNNGAGSAQTADTEDGHGINVQALNRSEITVTSVDSNTITDNTVDGIALLTNGDLDPLYEFSDGNTSRLIVGDPLVAGTGVTNNVIRRNGDDGVSIRTLNPEGSASEITSEGFIQAAFIDNDVSFNAANGYNIINTFESDMILAIAGVANSDPRGDNGATATSRVSENGAVGIRVENNAQTLVSDNNIDISITGTSVTGNGRNAALADDERNGVYFRIGTSGGFSILDPDTAGLIGTDGEFGVLRQSEGGAVLANVQFNYMAGNGNIDFVTESFIATPEPPAIDAGNAFLDPKARFGLELANNEGDQIDVSRFGAFYDNPDEIKSSTLAFNDATSGANSLQNARRRNAQRNDTWINDAYTGLVVGGPPGQAAPTNPGGANNTTFDIGGFINGSANYAVAAAFPASIGSYVDYQTGALAGLDRFIVSQNGGVFTTEDPAPAQGDVFNIDIYNLAGLGSSTFRTNDGSVTTSNSFTNVISDFTTQIALGPQIGAGSGDAFVFGLDQTFTWSTGFSFGNYGNTSDSPDGYNFFPEGFYPTSFAE